MLNSLDQPLAEISAQQRMREAVAVLDSYFPGWDLFVDPERLDLSSAYTCLLGQVFKTYSEGVSHIAPRIGFWRWMHIQPTFNHHHMYAHHWQALLAQRRTTRTETLYAPQETA